MLQLPLAPRAIHIVMGASFSFIEYSKKTSVSLQILKEDHNDHEVVNK